jgi:gamma-glutamyltranspeptidase / glutathione hydrolase / leukotriene-C4 hydrolase
MDLTDSWIPFQGSGEFMLDSPDWAPIFAPNGRLARWGEKIKRTNYARTLKTIADNGPDAFYVVRHLYGRH